MRWLKNNRSFCCVSLLLLLGAIGFSILWFWVNAYAFLFAVIGFVVYVVFIASGQKRTTIHQTVIGSISGASPPVIGYTAVVLDLT